MEQKTNGEEYNPFERSQNLSGSKGYEAGEGDKNSPQASAGNSNLGIGTENLQKEADQPGGEEHAAGASNPNKMERTDIGAQPIETNKINKGDN